MIKKIFSALVVVLFATSMMAQSGLTCEDAIPVDQNYVGTIDGPCTLWYTANTYDLPLNVHFIPDVNNSEFGPEVSVDFTCVPGVYEDKKIDSLLTMVEDFGLSFPLELWCDLVVRNGRNEWDLSVNESYREQMAEFGLTYNVPAYVKVTFFESGTVSLKPDSVFKNCMEISEPVTLDDSISILPNDTDRVFVMPYTDWQKDSIQFVWTGEENLTIWLATYQCNFKPEITDGYVWNNYEIIPGVPFKLQISDIKDAIANNKSGGLFYGKMLSSTSGKLVVEKVPMGAIQGGAQLLKYDEQISIQPNEATLFCFPRTWGATQFLASQAADIKMYSSNTSDFSASETDANLLGVYAFGKSTKELLLSSTEMNLLTSEAVDDYIYVRFVSTTAVDITPKQWNISDCADKSLAIQPNVPLLIPARSSNTIYRLNYEEFKDSEIIIEWGGNSTLPTYIADTCSFTLSSKNARLVLSPAPTIKRQGTYTITAEQVESWASRVDADGMLYARFNPTNAGNVTFKVNKTVLDPIYTTISETLCYGESYEWNGQVYSKSGEYSQTFAAANGADSIVTLNLTIRPEVAAVEEKATVCYGESYTWQGTTYTETGEYSTTLQDENGCDYQAVLNLTVLPEVAATTETAEVPFGETYEWHGVTYVESGEYTITLQDEYGCDYQATLHLTVLPNPEKTDLQPTDMMSLNLQDAFKVMTMEQALWSAQDVKLHWDGVSPLHVFVAKQQVYALTPYNRHVLHYEMIPAGADWTLSKDMMAAWESYIVEGVLYVRFLTELPGTLTTTVAE